MKKDLIVTFHEIYDIGWFEKILLYLKSKYTFVELGHFANLSNDTYKKRFCHITFDDGHKSFYNSAYPILRKHEIPATIFVSPKIIISQENFWFQEVLSFEQNRMARILSKELLLPFKIISDIPFIQILKCLPLEYIAQIIEKYRKETKTSSRPFQNMILDEILEVENSGLITIGAHTLNHPILKNESDLNCDKEISGSIIQLKELLGHEIKYFAYPNGIPYIDFGFREIEILKKNNISIAVSTNTNYVSSSNNKFALPRIDLSNRTRNFTKIILKLGPYWGKIKSLEPNYEQKNRLKIEFLRIIN
jgi:peptidoglycan/xylan/chitin deacetylase (PgdA/CDA1 family)